MTIDEVETQVQAIEKDFMVQNENFQRKLAARKAKIRGKIQSDRSCTFTAGTFPNPFAFDHLSPPNDDNLFNGSALSNISPEHMTHPERQGFDSSKDIKLGSTSALEDSEIMNLISTIEREEQDEDE